MRVDFVDRKTFEDEEVERLSHLYGCPTEQVKPEDLVKYSALQLVGIGLIVETRRRLAEEAAVKWRWMQDHVRGEGEFKP